jgi:hypothetical protein
MIVHPVSALAFEGEPGPADLMKRPPRDPHAPLIRRPQVIRSAFSGALLTVAALVEYAARLDRGETYARAAAMVVVILGSLFLVLKILRLPGGCALRPGFQSQTHIGERSESRDWRLISSNLRRPSISAIEASSPAGSKVHMTS